MLETSARLLRLLALLQARASWSGADLAERLEVTPRTLRRDVDRLRSLGYPIDSAAGIEGGYSLGKGAALPPLHFDEDEALAVFIGLHTAADTEMTGADTASIRALSKLEQVLPTRLKRKLATLRTSVLKLGDRAPSLSLSDVATLASACSERQVAHFEYASPGTPKARRNVEPHRIVRVGQRWYLVAWDCARQAWRTFRLDRMTHLETTEERFKARGAPHDDLVRYVKESLSLSPYKYKGRLLMHAAADELRPRVSAFHGVVEPISEDRCVLSTGAHSFDAILFGIAALGVDFEVLDPPELLERALEIGGRLARATPPRKSRG